MSAKDFQIEKLKGISNFHTWKFAIKNLLEMNDLDKYLTDEKVAAEDKLQKKTKNILSLSVEPQIFVHIQNADTAVEFGKNWENFMKIKDCQGKLAF